jgi:TatD DNase family protein
VVPASSEAVIDLIDTHAHLDAPEFDADLDAVLARAQAAGVVSFVVPAVSWRGFEKLKLLSARHQWQAAYGLHPMYLAEHTQTHLEALPQWLEDAVAVGECGLDYFLPELDVDQQRHYFEQQIQLALRFELPLIVHARRALEEVLQTLKRLRPKGGVVHSFAGSLEQAQALHKINFKIGIGGPVTYPRAQRLREIVRQMPLESMVLETDAPDQPLCGRQGARNAPEFLPEVLQVVATLRGESAAAIATQCNANARELFG